MELEKVSEGLNSKVLPGAEIVVTPLEWQALSKQLKNNPDKEWVELLVRGTRGIQSGS